MEKVYPFNFVSTESTDKCVQYSPSLIPRDVWVHHILIYLSDNDKKALRSSCRGFQYLTSKVWKPWVLFSNFKRIHKFQASMIRNQKKKWPIKFYGIQLTEKSTEEQYNDFLGVTETHKVRGIKFRFPLKYPTHLDSRLFCLYSQNIIHLDLSGSSCFDTTLIAVLPSTLKILNLNHCNGINNSIFGYIPSSLTHLDLGFSEVTSFDMQYTNLDNLVYLNLSHTYFAYTSCVYFPQNLYTMDISFTRVLSGYMQVLPTTIKNLIMENIINFSEENFKSLPPKLTSLNIRRVSGEYMGLVEYLPQTLTSLDISENNLSNYSLSILPKGLIDLKLDKCTLNNNSVSYLPTGILRLSISANHLLSSQCMKFMPPKLTELNMSRIETIDDFILDKLPTTLTKLNISNTITREKSKIYAVPANIKELIIGTDYVIQTEGGQKFLKRV